MRVSRSFASSGAPAKSVILTAIPFCQTRPITPSSGSTVRVRRKLFERGGICRRLLQNCVGNIDQWRATFGNKSGCKFGAGAVGHVKRAALRIEDARRAFNNKPMQIARPNRFAKRFAQAVQKIEDERFLDLDFLFRTLELADAAPLPERVENPARPEPRQAAREEEKTT